VQGRIHAAPADLADATADLLEYGPAIIEAKRFLQYYHELGSALELQKQLHAVLVEDVTRPELVTSYAWIMAQIKQR
jgi:hypothetical protein